MPMMTYRQAQLFNRRREYGALTAQSSKQAVMERKEALALNGSAALSSAAMGYIRGMRGDDRSQILGVDMETVIGAGALVASLAFPAFGKKLGWWGQSAVEGLAAAGLSYGLHKYGLEMGKEAASKG